MGVKQNTMVERINKVAVLYSQHQKVVEIETYNLVSLQSEAGNKMAEDLIKVQTIDGNIYWCDSIEFENEEMISLL